MWQHSGSFDLVNTFFRLFKFGFDQKIALKAYIVFSFLKDIIENSALCSQEYTTYLFEELLVGGADDDGVSVAHHGNQHVEQEDWNQNLEHHKGELGHLGIFALPKHGVLVLAQRHVKQCWRKRSRISNISHQSKWCGSSQTSLLPRGFSR